MVNHRADTSRCGYGVRIASTYGGYRVDGLQPCTYSLYLPRPARVPAKPRSAATWAASLSKTASRTAPVIHRPESIAYARVLIPFNGTRGYRLDQWADISNLNKVLADQRYGISTRASRAPIRVQLQIIIGV